MQMCVCGEKYVDLWEPLSTPLFTLIHSIIKDIARHDYTVIFVNENLLLFEIQDERIKCFTQLQSFLSNVEFMVACSYQWPIQFVNMGL